MLSPEQLNNLIQACTAAVVSEGITGCPADLTIPQWAQESGWGMHMPPASNNPFGIKALAGQPSVTIMTPEFLHGTATHIPQAFRVFPTLKDAFDHHGSLIATGAPYGRAFEQYEKDKNILGLIRGIAPHYATDPNYASKLMAFLLMPVVQTELKVARVQA